MNPDLFVWTSDWHVNRPGKLEAHWQDIVAHIQSLDPAGVIDTGDCKDLYGAGTDSDLDQYSLDVVDEIPWATVTADTALASVLPGNHDEIYDYDEEEATDFSLFDAALWGPPYNWTCDWAAPQIRFIAIHSTIIHAPSIYKGFWSVAVAEQGFLEDELTALPVGWKAIVCSHAPLAPAFGNYIRANFGGTELRAILADHSANVICYLNGHRHSNANTAIVDGIMHINGPSTSYTLSNGHGGFMPIAYDSVAETITFDYRLGDPPFAQYAGFTPIVFSVPLAEPEDPPEEPGGDPPPSAGRWAARRAA